MGGLLLLGLVLRAGGVTAAFSGSATSAGTVSAASAFPTYPAQVVSDGAYVQHRLEEAPSSAATTALADTAGTPQNGVAAGRTDGPSLRWDLDETSGTTATDRSGGADPGALAAGGGVDDVGAAGWWGALTLSGTSTGYASAATVPVDTSTSFSVSVWAYVSGASLPSSNSAVVSAPGTTSEAFALLLQANGQWAFFLPRTDTANPAWDGIEAPGTASLQTWTHLVGVYDASAGSARIYVNAGTPAVTTKTSGWKGSSLQAGRGFYNAAWGDPWPGRIARLATYRRALSASEVTALYDDAPALAYSFSEGTGTTTADGSGNGLTGTLGAAASWTTAGYSGNALSLSGTSTSNVTSASAAVNTSSSFSVAAWVQPASSCGTSTVLAQSGTSVSGFYLQCYGGQWRFTMPRSDSTASSGDVVAQASSAASATWVHLAGVYDSTAQTITLYVNGVSQGTTAHTAVWSATGGVTVGKALYGGPVDFFTGLIDSVRLYTRALTATQVAALATPGMTAGMAGALQGAQQGQQASTAMAFAGSTNAYNATAVTSPYPFTAECWFKAATGATGTLIGLGVAATGLDTTQGVDRLVYLDSGGRLTFAVFPGSTVSVRSSSRYDDAAWHHVAATLGAAGMRLYVDGALVASSANTSASTVTGYWRFGGTRVPTFFPNLPANAYFTGTLDEVAIYPTQLSDQQIAWHYHANH